MHILFLEVENLILQRFHDIHAALEKLLGIAPLLHDDDVVFHGINLRLENLLVRNMVLQLKKVVLNPLYKRKLLFQIVDAQFRVPVEDLQILLQSGAMLLQLQNIQVNLFERGFLHFLNLDKSGTCFWTLSSSTS